jgi:hypothetical protein
MIAGFPSAPIVMIGLYAVGLVLMQADSAIKIKGSRGDSQERPDQKKPEFYSQGMDSVHEACVFAPWSCIGSLIIVAVGATICYGKD